MKVNNLVFISVLFITSLNSSYGMEENKTLMDAVVEHDLKEVQTLVKAGMGINKLYEYGTTRLSRPVLHAAVKLRYVDIVKELLAHGADINALDSEGFTALHRAIANDWDWGYISLIKELLYYGPDITIKNVYNMTATDIANKGIGESSSFIKLLLAEYKTLKEESQNNPTRDTLKVSIERGYYALVKEIVASGKVRVVQEDLNLAKAKWEATQNQMGFKTQNPIFKKIGQVLIKPKAITNSLIRELWEQSDIELPEDVKNIIAQF
jgi:Ankyrin repeats (3 copies)